MAIGVTRDDVEKAALLAEIIGGYDSWNRDENGSIRVMATASGLRCSASHHCPTCTCRNECEHDDVWGCVAAAIGASDRAVGLWMSVGLALGEAPDDRCEDASFVERQWVEENFGDVEINDELEVAALLRDGWMPPTYRLVR